MTYMVKMNQYGEIYLVRRVDESYSYSILYNVKGMLNSGNHSEYYDFKKPIVDGKCKFKRIIIQKIPVIT